MKALSITVRGREHEWCFRFYGDPAHLDDWRADGLDVYAVENVIPRWAGMWARLWCWVQDIINFKNPGPLYERSASRKADSTRG